MADYLETIFGPPMPRWKRGLWHTWFAVRHPLKAAVAGVLSTTSLSDHPMWPVVERARKRLGVNR